jgi:arylsulfatase A-like enzyme
MERLFPALGAARFHTIPSLRAGAAGHEVVAEGHEFRPAVLLKPGEARATSVEITPGATLVFAMGLGNAPAKGYLRFVVRADGREIFAKRIFTDHRERWWTVSAPLHGSGRVRLEFRGEHVLADGQPIVADADAEPWIALGSPRVYSPGPQRPRRVLVWISQDTVRADHLGTYGYARATSPTFDRVAREWTVFEHGVAPAPWTLPSMTSQFTSRYPSFHGAVLEDFARDERSPTLLEILATSGFTVLGVTANTFISPDFRLASGFDALRFTPKSAADVSRLALSSLDDWAGGDLALFVHYIDAHTDYRPPPPFSTMFDDSYHGRVTGGNFYTFGNSLTPAEIDHVKALYDGAIAYSDREIARLLEGLEQRGLLRDAVVVYSADHGEELKDHGGWTHSQTLYEEALRVPFAVRVPGATPRRVSQPVSLIDLAPTVLAAFGVTPPATFQGRSLLPLVEGRSLSDAAVFSETEHTFKRGTLKVAVRQGSTKYILVTPRGSELPPRIAKDEVYDLGADPGERKPMPVTAETQRLREQALAYITRARTERATGSSVVLSPEVEERLRALGYLQ